MLKELEQRTETDAGTVLDQIERVIRWSDEFRLVFVKCNHPVQRETIRRLLLDRLGDKQVLEVFLEKPIISLLDELSARWNPTRPPDAVCVYGLENSLTEQREASPVLGRLNHDRDLIRQAIPAALLIWLPDFALDYVARGAPDFWAWRSGVYEFPTNRELWRTDSFAVLDRDVISLFSLPLEDKRKEIGRLEELLRTAQTLPQRDKRVQKINADLLNQIGLLYSSLGRWEEALSSYRQSLSIFEILSDQANISALLLNISAIHEAHGEYIEALAQCEQALRIAETLGDQAGVAAALHDIGVIHQARREYAVALAKYKQSLKIEESFGNEAGMAASLHQIGTIYQARGDYVAAREQYRQALKIFEKLGDQVGVANAQGQIGTIYQMGGKFMAALAQYKQALKIFEKLGDQTGMARSHGYIGHLFIEIGRYAEAFEHLLLTLSTFKKLESPNAEIAVNALKELRAGWGGQAFDAAWRKATGGAVPDWLKQE